MKLLKTSVKISSNIDKVWEKWTAPNDIKQWNLPSEEWTCPRAENDAVTGGVFFYRMERIDGKDGFDYSGEYIDVKPKKSLEILLDDGRKSWINFETTDGGVVLTETFEGVDTIPDDVQEEFCKEVLEKFKTYVESEN